MELRTLDFEKEKSFKCGGKTYNIKDTLSFVRFKELQKLNLEFGYNATFQNIFERVSEAMNKMNEVKFVDAAVTLHNILVGIKNLDEKYDVAFRVCALFIDAEDEDPTVYDEAKMNEKIESWSKELDVMPFFQLAATVVPHWTIAYETLLKSGLDRAAEKASSLLQEKSEK